MSWRKFFSSKFGLLCLLTICASFAYLVFGEVAKRMAIEREIDQLKRQILASEKTSSDLSNIIDYFQSPGYQEREVRTKLNLQKPGEHAVALPAAGGASVATQNGMLENHEVENVPNWKKWWKYFFGI